MSEIKLSEAIRLGAALKPQHHNGEYFFVVVPSPKRHGDVLSLDSGYEASCAMGAAIDAAGLDDATIDAHRGWPRAWRPVLHLQEEACPACGRDHGNVYEAILKLNDEHLWTREQIADWVESIERAQETESRRAAAASVGTQQETATTSVSFAPKD